jgi:hypothetical protein
MSAQLTTVQHSALGDLHRFGRLYPPGPRQLVQRGTPQGFSRRTLQSLVDAGHARWEYRDKTWPSIVPVCAVCSEPITGSGIRWTHAHGIGPDARECGTGDGATATPRV